MTSVAAMQAEGLEKVYESKGGEPVHAVRGVSLEIQRGEIYAILGPNGAGKTTTISMLTTLLLPTAGRAAIMGYDVVSQAAQVRRHIGVTFQEMVLDEELTGRQALDFHGRLYGMSKAERAERMRDLVELVELTDALDRPIKSYSGGMKRRLELARGLMTSPDILVLDEPTQGLDPQNRVNIWRYIRALRDERGITLLLTTHYMDEAEALADRVGIIDHGQVVAEGRPRDLIAAMGADVVELTGSGELAKLAEILRDVAYVSNVESLPGEGESETGRLQIGVDHGDEHLAGLVQIISESDVVIRSLRVAKPSLGDVFMAYTGYQLRDE
ncbi:MAG: ATP-binding cassette domain-containing protein [Caldilineaceae bacterium]|nr:ATP-binding cassette domain-containing protein [Caldilineaceae bacterium]